MKPAKMVKFAPRSIQLLAVLLLVTVAAGQSPSRPVVRVRPAISSLAFSPDGTRLALGRYREVELIDPMTGRVAATLRGLENQVRGLAFSRDGRWLVAVGGNPGQFGEVRLYDVAKGSEVRAWRGHRDHITAVAFAPDGK
ncbi:MAG: WD40 repeat domain-containing protein, partial [Blastocatellia bacterium]